MLPDCSLAVPVSCRCDLAYRPRFTYPDALYHRLREWRDPLRSLVVNVVNRDPGLASPEVTVVLPCYNERAHVEQEIKRISAALDAAGMTYELLVVDDGSTDGSRELLAAIPGIRTILLPRNQGSGTARRIGTQQARGAVVAWTDADMTYPNELIPDLNSGLRVFKRSVARPYLRLLPPGFSCVTTITLAFLANGHQIKYVPIDYFKRSGRSKFHPF